MTADEQRADVIRYWWSLAEQSLSSAQRELDAGTTIVAINRVYYAAFGGIQPSFLRVTVVATLSLQLLGRIEKCTLGFFENLASEFFILEHSFGPFLGNLLHCQSNLGMGMLGSGIHP